MRADPGFIVNVPYRRASTGKKQGRSLTSVKLKEEYRPIKLPLEVVTSEIIKQEELRKG